MPRLFSSAILILVFSLSIFIEGLPGEILFIALGSFIAFSLINEMSGLLRNLNFDFPVISTAFMAVFYFILVSAHKYICVNDAVFFLFVNLIFISFFWLKILFNSGKRDKIKGDIVSIAVFFMIIIPLSCLSMIFMYSDRGLDGRKLLLFLIAVTKSGDIGGYVGGMLSSALMKGGNHKILPNISPKKSWEGTVTGLLLSVGVSVLLAESLQISEGKFLPVLFGILLFIGGFLGDITESALKRAANVKDSGKLLPGIGGALDLVDSFLFNSPAFYILLIVGIY